jgi:undecaprenyl diphosphate synthase
MSHKSDFPKHVAIIPDGNRRWARQHGRPLVFGHKQGVEAFERICDAAIDRGIKIITFYTFSSENWKRTKTEVKYLFRLLEDVFRNRLDKLDREGIRLVVSGRLSEFPANLQATIIRAVEVTKHNTRGIVHLCLNYGGRNEIIDAIKAIMVKEIKPAKVTTEVVRANLYHPEISDPDMIIRTSGEQRLSGYLLWQSEYAELYFPDKLWPDFTAADFDDALAEYKRRKRRFGK